MKPVENNGHPLWDEFEKDLEAVSSSEGLSGVKDKYLGRKRGLITRELQKLGGLDPEERSVVGKQLNQLKVRVQNALTSRQDLIRTEEIKKEEAESAIDVSLPGYPFLPGGEHPLRKIQREMEDISIRMGFTVVSGPEVETDYYNFEALNIPVGHPARDDQDTLYLTQGLLLRTHTSPVQIRTMESQEPPIRIVVPGRVYRRDTADATHSPMFHQLEGLVVEEGISLADLKGTLEVFLRELFSTDTRVRFRPSYFPFVEPGAEVDISCIFCDGGPCSVCKGSGWIEIMGAGMVHPRVLKMVGYDPERYTGFAWGMGIDRVALLKYRVSDLRLFFDNDLRFLRQF